MVKTMTPKRSGTHPQGHSALETNRAGEPKLPGPCAEPDVGKPAYGCFNR